MDQLSDYNRQPLGQPVRWRMPWPATVGLAVAAAAIVFGLFFVDTPVVAAIQSTRQVKNGKTIFTSGELQRVLRFFESYGHGLGAAVALLIVALAARHWKAAIRLAAAIAAAAIPYALLARLLVNRCRPHKWTAWAAGDIWSTFAIKGASFPSGHTATAFAFSVVLATAYPRGRWIFLSLATLCGLARVLTGAHFVSDVFAGMFIGLAAGLWAVHSQTLTRLIARIESRNGK